MAVDAVMRILDTKQPSLLDLRNVKIVTKVGGTIDDSELVEGMVFDQKAAKAAGGPTRIEKAKIALIQVRACEAFASCCMHCKRSSQWCMPSCRCQPSTSDVAA